MNLYSEVLALAGGPNKIRGFATNVANYQPLGSMTDTGMVYPRSYTLLILCRHISIFLDYARSRQDSFYLQLSFPFPDT